MIKKFQLGGQIPQVFNIDVPQQPRVDLGAVINTASMPIDSGVNTYSQLKNIEFQNDRLKIEKDREERLKAQEKINNLKIISEFADKASQWGVLPGRQKELESIMGELNDPNLMARAIKDPNAAAEYIGKYVSSSSKISPYLRERKIYDESVKEYDNVYQKYLNLIPNAADVLDTEFGKKMEEWSNRLERFANGDPTVSQTSITPAGMGIQDMISEEGLKHHVEQAKQVTQSKLEFEKIKMQELEEEIKGKQQVREGLYNAAKERLGIQGDEITPEQDRAIRAEIAKPKVDLEIAKTNSEIAQAKLQEAQAIKSTFESVGLKLKNVAQWSAAASAINNALPADKKVLAQDLSDLDAVLKTLKPDELEAFFQSLQKNDKFNSLFSNKDEFSADYRSYLDYIKRPGNEDVTYPEFKSTNSSVNYNSSGGGRNVTTTKDGTEINAARIGNNWVQNDAEFKKKYNGKVTFAITRNPATGQDGAYMMFSHAGGDNVKELLRELTGWDYVDTTLWFDSDIDEFETSKVPGSFHKDGILYVPIPDAQKNTQQSSQQRSKPGQPTVVPPKQNYVPDYIK